MVAGMNKDRRAVALCLQLPRDLLRFTKPTQIGFGEARMVLTSLEDMAADLRVVLELTAGPWLTKEPLRLVKGGKTPRKPRRS